MKIGINAGHGAGKDHNRGFIQVDKLNECNEGDNNFRVYELLKAKLEEYQGVEVVTVRPKITDNPTLTERGSLKCDCLLQIHSNSCEGNGPEMVLRMAPTARDLSLAKRIRDKIIGATGLGWRALKFSHLVYNKGKAELEFETQSNPKEPTWHTELAKSTADCAIIVEMAYHDVESQARMLRTQRNKFATAIVSAVVEEYGLVKKQPAVQKAMQTAPEGKLFQVNLGAFKNFQYMTELINQAKKAGFEPYMTLIDDPKYKK